MAQLLMEGIETRAVIPMSNRARFRALNLSGRRSQIRPEHPQDRDQIAPALRALLNDLATGRRVTTVVGMEGKYHGWPLFLHGDTGRGKTSAALCLVNAVPDSVFIEVERVIDEVYARDAWIWREGIHRPFMVVEELGLRGEVSEREKTAIEKLANAREFHPTLWISNHEPEWIANAANYGERVHSRICSGTCVLVGGPDRRFYAPSAAPSLAGGVKGGSDATSSSPNGAGVVDQ